MDDATPKKPMIKAKDNPSYLLATLYGQPTMFDDDLQARNRTAWNRYMAETLTDDQRASLIEEKRLNTEDLTPFTPKELSAIEKAFSERHQKAGSTASKEIQFSRDIDFSYVEFDVSFRATGFLFPKRRALGFLPVYTSADFTGAVFSGNVDFRGAVFSGNANFKGTTFSGHVGFDGAVFSGGADFDGAVFCCDDAMGAADFRGTVFSGRADFKGTTFSGHVGFNGTVFSNYAHFDGAVFSDYTYFDGTTFSYYTYFDGTAFSKPVSFINADLKGLTSFESAAFNHSPPTFFNAKLHEGTIWQGVKWPKLPSNPSDARKFVDAYERLKMEMDRLKKHEDELDFFAREQQSRRILHGDWKPVSELTFFGRTIPIPSLKIPEVIIPPKPRKLFGWSFALPQFTIQARTITLQRPAPGLPIRLYGLLCDYGRSYVRPFYGLLITIAVGFLAFWPYFGLHKFKKAIGLSIANTLGVLGFRKDFVDPQIIEALPGSLKVFSAVQTIAGIVLLFLFGLAIRNRFRMK